MGHGHCVTQRTDQSQKRASMSFSVNSGYFAFVSSSLSSATAAAKPDQKMKLPGPGTQFRAEGSGLCPGILWILWVVCVGRRWWTTASAAQGTAVVKLALAAVAPHAGPAMFFIT